MVIILVLCGLSALCFGIAIFRSLRQRRRIEQEQPYISSFVSMKPMRTVYDEQQRTYRTEVISDTSNGRKIDGHSLRTREDWERWSIYDHKARDYANEFNQCQKELQSSYCNDPDEVMRKARIAYARFESLCTTYGIWNFLIHDHAIYIPTAEQKRKSQVLLQSVEDMVIPAKEQKAKVDQAKDIAFDFIDLYQEKAYRTDLVRKISSEMEVIPADASKLIKTLCNIDMLREEKNDKGRIYVRRAK